MKKVIIVSFGPELFTALAEAFSDDLLPGRIVKVETGDSWAAFRLSTRRNQWLLFSWDARSYGCGLVEDGELVSLKKMRASRSSFGEGLKKNFLNGSLLSAGQLHNDRILYFEAERLVGAGFPVRLGLIFEGTERNSNLISVDSGEVIIDAAKHIHPDENRYRTILPGVSYTPPPPLKGVTLREMGSLFSPADLSNLKGLGRGLSRIIQDSWGDRSPEELTSLATRVMSGRGLLLQRQGDLLTVFPEKLPGCDVVDGALLEGCGTEVLRIYFEGERKKVLSRVKKVIHREIKGRLRHRDGMENQLSLSIRGEEFLKMGNLLLSLANALPPRGEAVEVADWETGETLSIPVDPRLSGPQNAHRYFKKYKKGKIDRDALAQSIISLDEGIRELEEQLEVLDAIDDPELLALSADDILQWLTPEKGKASKRKKQSPPPYIRLENRGDLIYVGLNARGNRQVTFKVAGPGDYWFHAHEIPGAHVILKTPGRDSPPEASSIEIAASLAGWFSRAKGDRKVQVDWTERKNVRAIPGNSLAHVTYANPRTILISPDRWKEFPEAARSRRLADKT